MFKGKPRFDLLDHYLVQRDYEAALGAIAEEIKRRPENFNLLLRQAEILGLAGDRQTAISVYCRLAQHYAEQGFYARAIAVIKKVLRLDPTRQDVTKELAGFIAAQQEEEKLTRVRSRHAAVPPVPPPAPASASRPVDPAQQQAERERAASRFLTEFPAGALERLLAATSARSFDAGQVIVHEGQPGTSMFFIDEGTVEVCTKDPSGEPLVLAQLGAGEFFGEIALLSGKPRTATIIARSAVTVIEITSDHLDAIAGEFPRVREVLQRFYEQRAQATVEAVINRMRSGRG